MTCHHVSFAVGMNGKAWNWEEELMGGIVGPINFFVVLQANVRDRWV